MMSLTENITSMVREIDNEQELANRIRQYLDNSGLLQTGSQLASVLGERGDKIDSLPLDEVLDSIDETISEPNAEYEKMIADLENILKAIASSDTAQADSLRGGLRRLQLTQELGIGLRLAEYKDGEINWGVDKRDGEVLSLSRLVHPNMVTHGAHIRDYGNSYNYSSRRFSEPLTLAELQDLQNAIAAIDKPSALTKNFREIFVGQVGQHPDILGMHWDQIIWSKNPINFFDYFFYDVGNNGIESSALKYDVTKMPRAIRWLARTSRKLSSDSPYFASIADRVDGFIQSPAYKEMVALIDESTGKNIKNLDGKDFDKENMRDMHEERFSKHHPTGFLRPDDLLRPVQSKEEAREHRPKRPDFLGSMYKITRRYQDAVHGLRSAVLDFEYALTLANCNSSYPVSSASPRVGLGYGGLAIKDGRNLPLVLTLDNPQKTVVPNDVEFSSRQNTLALVGANGAGKTHLLEMIVNNMILSHKAMNALAVDMETVPIYMIKYAVDASVHRDSASSFQNEIKGLIEILNSIEKYHARGEKAIVVLDEPFRGTDSINGIPLLIGLMEYMESRGIYLAFSTHFNAVSKHQEIIEQLGINVRVYTMDRQTHKLVPGVGRSYGIEVAEELDLNKEIVEIAEMVQQQADSDVIHANGREKISNPIAEVAFRPLSSKDLDELGITAENRFLGAAANLFRKYTSLHFSSADYGNRAFTSHLTANLSDEERRARVDTINKLLGNYIYDNHEYPSVKAYEEIGLPLGYFSDFDKIFLSDRRRNKSIELLLGQVEELGPSMLSELMQLPEDIDKYKSFLTLPLGIPYYFAWLQRLVSEIRVNKLTACEKDAAVIDDFFKSEAYKEISEFSGDFQLLNEPSVKGREKEDVFTFDDWKDWGNLCFDYKEDLSKVYDALASINFHVTVAKTIDKENWTKVQENASSTDIKVKNARNTRLENSVQEVTPVDIYLGPRRPITVLSGTNGGGKTQYLQAAGSHVYFKEQLGYVPAESATMGHFNFIYAMLTTAKHSESKSSFQNETLRIKEGIEQYIAAGEPRDGIIILDEPFKGTSEEEAIPLLVGLIKYFERRNVQVLFTTHYSGLFDCLEKLDEPSKVGFRPLFVDYFSETETERYKVKEGIGKSAGIRVAEILGLPEEIITMAKKVDGLTNGN